MDFFIRLWEQESQRELDSVHLWGKQGLTQARESLSHCSCNYGLSNSFQPPQPFSMIISDLRKRGG